MAIVYYTKQDEYDLVNSGQDCIGWTVVDQAGNRMGEVTEMLINTDNEMVDSILVDRRKRIAAQDFALQNGRVVVRGIMHDGELEMSETENAESANYAAMPQRAAGDQAHHVAGYTRAASEGEAVLPVIEEQLRLGKRTVEKGAARVSTRVEEVPVEEQVTLREENVTVERRPVDRPVENAPAAFREGTIEVTEMAEVPVVAKEARVVEEVVVGKNVTERTETVRDSVKRTDVEVDEIDSPADANQNRSRHNG
jgi:uncharacterized protein (TIGR02271 family)